MYTDVVYGRDRLRGITYVFKDPNSNYVPYLVDKRDHTSISRYNTNLYRRSPTHGKTYLSK